MNFDFFSFSGWVFGAIAAVMAVFQYFKKEECRKKLNLLQNNKDNSSGYQAENIIFDNKNKIKMEQNNSNGGTGYQAENMTVNK